MRSLTPPGSRARRLRSDWGFRGSIFISRQHLHDVLEERKRVSPNLAARLGRLFARDGALWLRMQIALDLWEAERDEDVKKVKPLPAA